MSAAHIHRHQCPLHERILFQRQGVGFAGRINLGDAHLNDIAPPQQLPTRLGIQRRVNMPYPGIP